MLASTTIELLRGHQERATAIMDRAEPLLRAGRSANAPQLVHTRLSLMRLLTEYQMFKHREIFDPAIQRGSPEQQRAAREMKAQCIAIGEEFRTYTAKWSSVSAADRWDEYQPAALDIIARIRRHIASERVSVEAILLASASATAERRAG